MCIHGVEFKIDLIIVDGNLKHFWKDFYLYLQICVLHIVNLKEIEDPRYFFKWIKVSRILNSHRTSQNDYFTSVSTKKGSCPNCFHYLTIIVFLPPRISHFNNDNKIFSK